ncbi:Uncharacterised protein [Streptococcus pneumoniae]|nr:Uncharacterised protein [Streptococcus pneumoniae]
MKIFQKMCASTVIITTLLGTGGTINSVYADSIEQQSKLGIEQETDKQIIVKFKADLDLPYEDGIEKQIQSQTNDKIISPGEFKAVMEMVLLLLIWNTDGY